MVRLAIGGRRAGKGVGPDSEKGGSEEVAVFENGGRRRKN